MRKKIKKLDIIIGSVLLFVLLLSGIGIWYFGKDYAEAEAEYEKLGRYVELVNLSQSEELGTSTLLRFDIDWENLKSINPDIVAWVVIPGTDVNYPVVQTTDNSTYLRRTFEGAANACGTIFMNTYNRADFSDWNTVIYGHNMRDGSMFAVLNEYQKKEFYDTHKEVWILTPKWQRQYQIISAHLTQDQSETYAVEFAEGEYERHVCSEVEQSRYDTGTGYDASMPMVTLSTCHGHNTLSRMVLVCQPVYEVTVDDGDMKNQEEIELEIGE